MEGGNLKCQNEKKNENPITLQQSNGQLVGVEVFQVFSEVIVQEPSGKTLQHLADVESRNSLTVLIIVVLFEYTQILHV